MERLRLDWKRKASLFIADPGWYAFVGPLRVGVGEHATRYYTEVDGAPCTVHDTQLAAQLAAEAAALDLLMGAVASFGVTSFARIERGGFGGIVLYDHRRHPFLDIDADDATRLACALLAAARVKP